MRVDIITLFPQMLTDLLCYGVTGRAIERGLVTVRCWNPRDYVDDPHRTIDDRPYGGGPGMVMKYQPLKDAFDAIAASTATRGKRIYLSPQGQVLTQAGVRSLAQTPHLVLLAGRYEGVDERLIASEIDEEWSIGDYVLSGGELAAAVIIDACARLQQGALNHAQSATFDSFSDNLLDFPHYTRPEHIAGLSVPAVLLSGDHAAIAAWRAQQARERTMQRRPDLLQ